MKQIAELMPQDGNNKSWNLQGKQIWLDNRKSEIVALYGSAKDFGVKFNPDIQVSCARNIERSLSGSAPTLRQLEYAYEIKAIRVWFAAQFENLNEFTGVKNKMSVEQMQMLADIFIIKVPYLKASEILLFFHKFKSGELGELYGSVDPLKVSLAINPFLEWRSRELDKIRQKQREEKREKEHNERGRTTITREEYEKRKKLKDISSQST